MADSVELKSAAGTVKDAEDESQSPEKRKADSEGDGEPLEKKKFSMTMNQIKRNGPKKMSIALKSTPKPIITAAPIKMSLSTQKPKEPVPASFVGPKSAAIASAFNADDESDEEEMPPEAKMRMRNIGRETPTAAGPNSFGKNRFGFCDRQKIIERELKSKMEDVAEKD